MFVRNKRHIPETVESQVMIDYITRLKQNTSQMQRRKNPLKQEPA